MMTPAGFLVPYGLLLPLSPSLPQEPSQARAPFSAQSTLSVEPGKRVSGTAEVRVAFQFEGFVLGPSGAPAEGAVVVSSAGGRAVTSVTGSYRLEVRAPIDATSVRITAVGRAGGNLVASASVALNGARNVNRVEPLQLALGTSCSPEWLPTFGPQPGVGDGFILNPQVNALVVFDDGSGPALYVGGSFVHAGAVPANSIARWDGSGWSALGGGTGFPTFDEVRALAVYDDGGGPSLYVGGFFDAVRQSDGQELSVNNIAKWNGLSWSALGTGIDNGQGGAVDSLAVYDDGSGPALYAGGLFTTAGGISANRIAKWNATSWSALGSGMNGDIGTLTVFDDGSGPKLYAGGSFTTAGGVAANRIAKWDGTSWSALASGMNDEVDALAVYDDGSGPALYAGGDFTTAGGISANRIAKWNATSWSALGGMNLRVDSLTVHDDGSGPALYAGGAFTSAGGAASRIAKWNGTSWSALGSGLQHLLSYSTLDLHGGTMAVYDDGGGAALYVGGSFTTAGGVGANNLAKWNGTSWSALGSSGLSNLVRAVVSHDDGGGPALYVGGSMKNAGGVEVNYVARWDGSNWSALGSGVSDEVWALAVYDDGSGPALYAGGYFASAGGSPASRIAKWDGSSWSALGAGVIYPVLALAVYDHGGGPALYAGGQALASAPRPISKWNGSSWSLLGSGVTGHVRAMAVYDDGSGAALYVGGAFGTAGGLTAVGFAKWNGSSWSAPGTGTAYGVSALALAVYDDGSGPALYVGGEFFDDYGFELSEFGKWNGSSWAFDFGAGFDDLGIGNVFALAVHDDASGPALYAGGNFHIVVNGAGNLARWDGSSWSALGNGVTGVVHALTVHDDGSGPELFVGGEFSSDRDHVAGGSFIAKWGREPDTTPPSLSCPSSVLAIDGLNGPPGEVVTFSVTAIDCADPSPSVVCVPPSGTLFPRGTTLVTCTATDASGNQSTCEFPITVQIKVKRR